MPYEKYDDYKDSGVEWLGIIPEHWEVVGSKRLFKQRKERARQDDEQLTASQKYGVIYQKDFMELENRRVTQVEFNPEILKRVEPNDFLISMRSFQGGIEYCKYAGSVSSAYVALIPIKHIVSEYFRHLFKSYPYIKALSSTSNLVRDGQALRFENFSMVDLLIVPKEEQKAIADFIDTKTSQIDAHITKQERLVELLKERRVAIINRAVTCGLDENVKLKDSGIQWLGKIPGHWEVKKLKHLSLVKRGSSPRPIDDPRYFDDKGEFAWVRIADVSKNSKYLLHTTQRLSKLGANKSTKIYPKQIFLSIAGTVGKPMIAKIKCCIHDGFVWFDKLNKKINIDYLYYIFLNGEAYKGLGKLGTQLNLNTDTVGMISVPLPPKDEQLEIVNYIKKEDDKFFTMLTSVQNEISYLKEYRQSLISNAVTGKIKVI